MAAPSLFDPLGLGRNPRIEIQPNVPFGEQETVEAPAISFVSCRAAHRLNRKQGRPDPIQYPDVAPRLPVQ